MKCDNENEMEWVIKFLYTVLHSCMVLQRKVKSLWLYLAYTSHPSSQIWHSSSSSSSNISQQQPTVAASVPAIYVHTYKYCVVATVYSTFSISLRLNKISLCWKSIRKTQPWDMMRLLILCFTHTHARRRIK